MHLNPEIAALLTRVSHPALPVIELSLGRMQALLQALGHPHTRLPPVIHLAGTNGKGSTLAFLRAMFQAQGHRVHAYTSPHLVRFNERIMLANQEITDAQLLPLLHRVAHETQAIPVTFFEATTALAFLAFSETKADSVLLETGLGGRLDATNVIDQPAVTVITPIDYDHMEFLGETIEKIAAEKAGILKPNVPCVVGAQRPEVVALLRAKAAEIGAPIILHGHDWHYELTPDGIRVQCLEHQWPLPMPALLGPHQLHNAALASVVAKQYGIGLDSLALGTQNARWPARLQRLAHGPLVETWGARGAVMLDGAHNESAARVLADWLVKQRIPSMLLLGMMRRKDPAPFLAVLAPHIRRVIAIPIAGEDCHSPAFLAEIAKQSGVANVMSAENFTEVSAAIATETSGTLLIAGSLFLAGEILKNNG